MANQRNPRIFYLSADGHVNLLAWGGQRFAHTDVTGVTLAPGADLTGGLAAMAVGDNGDERVYYLSRNPAGHVQQLAWIGQWVRTDITGSTAAKQGSSVAVTGAGRSLDPRVYYVGGDGHVLESAWDGSGWSFRDVTASVPTLTQPAEGGLAATSTGDNYDPRVYYIGADAHVWQLGSSNGEWVADDVTSEAGAPSAVIGGGLVAMGTGAQSDPRVFYADGGGGVHQLAWIGQWITGDLTEQTHAPSAVIGGGLAAMGTGAQSDPRVYYFDNDGQVRQLAYSNGGWVFDPLAGTAAPGDLRSGLVAMGTDANLDPRVYNLSSDGHVWQLAWTGQWLSLDVFTLTGETVPNAVLPSALATMGAG
jgi:hypothetical protein